ncbi:MAG: M24 family metallopeptidase [Actinomycetes bacterium]
MPDHHERRRHLLADQLSGQGLDAALVTTLLNVRYLTGFTGSAAAALVRADGSAVLTTDGRYETQVAEECPDLEAVITRAGRRQLADRALGEGATKLGFEDLELSVAAFRDLPHVATWEPLGATLMTLRMQKDAVELDALRRACAATDQALRTTLPRIGPGVTERQVARWIDDELRERSEGPGFDTIVASGPNGAIPHHQPTDRLIERGDLVTIDFGAKVDGYHADMTRTLLIGSRPDAWQAEVYAAVLEAQAAGLSALNSQVMASEVDSAAREVLTKAGLGEHFVHGLGHGVGLQIHEAPYLGSTSTDKLDSSVPVTVEPGVYVPGRGGVRIEDTVVVHADRVESLTTTTRELLSVP